MYVHKTPPNPTPNTPFSGLNLKVGKMNYCLDNISLNYCLDNISWLQKHAMIMLNKNPILKCISYSV